MIEKELKQREIDYISIKRQHAKSTASAICKPLMLMLHRFFLISLKAGGTGLNLTSAEVVIHFDPWWNVSAQNQATDRAYRIGRTTMYRSLNYCQRYNRRKNRIYKKLKQDLV